MSRRLTIWGGIGGYNGVFPTEGNREMVCDFLDQCAEAGVNRFIPGYTPDREMCLRFEHGRGGHDPADILAVVPGFYSVHGWDPLSFWWRRLIKEESRSIPTTPSVTPE